jgi:HPt (histidine-containing phosphotransfer) domain-containing protein
MSNYINFEDGVKRVMNNKAFYLKLLGKFKNDTSLTDLKSAVQASDFEAAKSQTHALKGLAANLSLSELHAQSLALETIFKEGGCEGRVQEISQSFDALQAVFDATVAEINKFLTEVNNV